jgi:hypothetical protein
MTIENILSGVFEQVVDDATVSYNDIVGFLTITLTDLSPWNLKCSFSDKNYLPPAGVSKTALDINYRRNPKFGPGKFIQVTFVIDESKAPYAKFIPKNGAVDFALTRGDTNSRDMVWNLTHDEDRQISFLIKYKDLQPGARASYNLGIRFTDVNNSQIQTDIFYDPQVPNDGS